MKESYNADAMKIPKPIENLLEKHSHRYGFSKFAPPSDACHPERSEGSQLTDEPRLLPSSFHYFLNFPYLLHLLNLIPPPRPPQSPPAFPAQSVCLLPPCSSPAGSLRRIRRVLAPPSPIPRCWSRRCASARRPSAPRLLSRVRPRCS